MDAKLEQKSISIITNVLMLVLVLYVSWLSAQGIWFVLDDQDGTSMVLSDSGINTPGAATKVSRDVSRLHLFGKEGVKPVVKKDLPQEAPKTRLRLKLKGVFTSEQASESSAIVEEQGKGANYYRVGDSLPGNAVLETVYSDRILLRRAGKLETLYFDDASETKSNRIAQAPKKNVNKKTSGRNNIDSPEQFMEEATRQLADNPEQALKSVGLAPSDQGYVYQGNNPMLSGLNLKKGDIIRSVNGHELGDIQKDKALMKSLYEQGSLDVEVMRDGASFYINYPLR